MTPVLLRAEQIRERNGALSLREAALLIGMSKFWLRDRIGDTPAVSAFSFKTRGDTGHWRFKPTFAKFAESYKAGAGLSKSTRPAAKKVKSKPAAAHTCLMQIYRESVA